MVKVMQMVAIVFRKSLESEVLAVLRACHVRTFTDIAEVLGAGETGLALNTFVRPGFNSLVLVALAEADVERVVKALREFRDRAVAQQHGAAVPLHVFVLPCEQVV
jgi:nitrogen regulatory protein PII